MTRPSDKDFYTLWSEAVASSDRETYISEWATSTIWGDPEQLTDKDLLEIAGYVGRLWDAAHMSVKDICEAAGLTQAALGCRFCIPMRTVWDWCRGVRTPPDYVRLMMVQLLGLL